MAEIFFFFSLLLPGEFHLADPIQPLRRITYSQSEYAEAKRKGLSDLLNATIADDPVAGSNLAGTLTFADAGPNTRTTQVFINLVDNTSLDADGFSPVCKISNATGLAVAQKLYAGYGEGAPDGKGPDQNLITTQGDAYLKPNFPLLDYVQSAILK
jgi:hypothetical protein